MCLAPSATSAPWFAGAPQLSLLSWVLSSLSSQALEGAAGAVVESSSLEVFQRCVEVAPGDVG